MAFCGVALALAALGNLLLASFPGTGEWLRYACGLLAAVILLLFALKLTLDFPHVREELKTPAALSVLPTSTQALMLLSTYLKPYIGNAAVGMWYAAIIIHLGIMTLFFARFVLRFKWENVLPTWFVPLTGFVTISVCAPVMGALPLGQLAFYVGLILYFVTLLLVVYRLVKVKALPEPLRLTTAIFAAPMSLCLVGYLSSFAHPNEALVYFMLTIVIVSYAFVAVKMPSLLRIKFYPTYAAFTFPSVISAVAFRVGNAFLIERGLTLLTPMVGISLWAAIAVVAFVLAHYVRYFFSGNKS